MRWRGPGVRVRPGRAQPVRNWPILQQMAPACTFLQLRAVGREKRGHFFAANFTSCHVIACICRYLHIKKFSRMNEDVSRTPTHKAGLALRCEPFARRTGILPVSNQESGFGSSIELETGETPVLRQPSLSRAASSLFQGIPAYSNIFFLATRMARMNTNAQSRKKAERCSVLRGAISLEYAPGVPTRICKLLQIKGSLGPSK
jgi:hypothetical protein